MAMGNVEIALRRLYIADNLDFLRSLDDGCIDFFYNDPPFADNDTSTQGGEAGEDELADEIELLRRWGIEDEDARELGIVFPSKGYLNVFDPDIIDHQGWMAEIEHRNKRVHDYIEREIRPIDEKGGAYAIYLAVRLIEIYRVLAPSGVLCLHCDDRTVNYTEHILDVIFGRQARNKLIWKRSNPRSSTRGFSRNHDVILVYPKSNDYIWNPVYTEYDPEYLRKQYRHEDGLGRYCLDNLTGPAHGATNTPSTITWRGIDPTLYDRCWSTPTQGGMNDFIVEHDLIPGWPNEYPDTVRKLEALDAAGLIYWPQTGRKMPLLKRYLASTKGIPVSDVILDIGPLNTRNSEREGYPTQKPAALVERLILAFTNPGDLVADMFSGGGTTAVAAERNDRRWVVCDNNPRAWTMIKRQFAKAQLFNGEVPEPLAEPLCNLDFAAVRGPVDRGRVRATRAPTVRPEGRIRNRHKQTRTREWMLPRLLAEALFPGDDPRIIAGRTWCCGKPVYYDAVSLGDIHLDHVIPKSKGGRDTMDNRAALCERHNILKSDRDIRIEDLRLEVLVHGETQLQIESERTGHHITITEVIAFVQSLVRVDQAHENLLNALSAETHARDDGHVARNNIERMMAFARGS